MSKSTFTRITMLAVLLALFALAGTSLMAQSTTDGAIGGTVTDQTNAVVAGAKVTVRNLETNASFSGETDTNGAYRITHLRPGTYEVTITSGSFAPFKADRIIVEVGRVTSIEAKMNVGGKTETVSVTGEAPVINTVQPDVQNNINDQIINNTPIPIRRYSSFALGTPGAVPDGSFGLIAFRGISGLLNNSTVDGGDNNTAYWSEERGRTRATATISQDSVREFQINTSNFSAEYGRAAGGVMNAVTKSGTNSLHGGARLYVTDSAMWAYNPFSIFNGVPLKPSDRRYVFGASLGGPIKKDKLFFFFNWDQQKENAPGVAIEPLGFDNTGTGAITVALPASCSASNLTDGQTLACRGVSQATANKGMDFLRGLTGPVSRNKDHWIIFPKVDWIITPSNTLTLSWNHMRWNSIHGIQTAATVQFGTNSWGDDFVNVDTGNARLVSLLNNRISNEFRVSIGREHQFENSNPPGPGEPTTGLNGKPPQITVTGPGGTFQIGKPNFLERGALPLENRKQFTDIMSVSLGTHMLKFGFDANHANDQISNLFTEGGAYSYSTRAAFLTDYAAFIGANAYKLCGGVACFSSFSQGIGPVAYSYSTNDYSTFVQDEWHALPRLTVSMGLRWEYQQFPNPFWPNPALPQTAFKPHDGFDFGPRLGAAWDITGDGKTVLRGGWGLYYGRVINAYIANELTGTGSAASQLSTGSLSPSSAAVAGLGPFGTLSNALPSSAPPGVNVYGVIKMPRIHEADVILEREITRNTVVSVSYMMSAGQRLPEVFDRNLPVPTATITYAFNGGPFGGTTQTVPVYSGSRPNTTFNNINSLEYVGKSRYDGFVFQINRRMTNGLQLSSSYTHGRATDTNQVTGTGATAISFVDVNHPEVDKGTSNFDIRHRVNFSAVWQPKFTRNEILGKIINGFSISPTFGISSGAPFSPSISGNAPCTRLATDAQGAAGTVCQTSGSTTTATANRITPTSSGFNGSNGIFRLYTTSRNSFRFPTTAGANMRVSRKFKIVEGKNIELLAEVFNISNHLNYTSVDGKLYTVSAVTNLQPAMNYNPTFGALNQANNQDHANNVVRQFQFGARFEF